MGIGHPLPPACGSLYAGNPTREDLTVSVLTKVLVLLVTVLAVVLSTLLIAFVADVDDLKGQLVKHPSLFRFPINISLVYSTYSEKPQK